MSLLLLPNPVLCFKFIIYTGIIIIIITEFQVPPIRSDWGDEDRVKPKDKLFEFETPVNKKVLSSSLFSLSLTLSLSLSLLSLCVPVFFGI